MPSRRRSRNKNLGNNLADVQRRLRFLERRPVRSKLSSRVVTKAAMAPNSVSPDEVTFGVVQTVPPGQTADDYAQTIENPKEGQFLITTTGATAGESQVYSETTESYISVADPVASASADAASDAAALAAANAQAAQTTADGKNKVYRQASQPATGPFAEGDLWFDTDDDNRIYRYTGGSWSTAVQLGNNAIASLSASKLTAGTIDANVITVSNINAGNITAGNIASARLTTTQLNATNITAGTLSGITIQTSGTGNRIAMTNTDELHFFNNSNTRIGTIGPFELGGANVGLMAFGGENAFDAPIMHAYYEGPNVGRSMYLSGGGLAASPSISLNCDPTPNGDENRIFITAGGSTSLVGSIGILAGQGGITIASWTGSGAGADYIEFATDYTDSGSISMSADRINLLGVVKLYGESLGSGTGAPPNYTGNEADQNIGAIFFRYT
jgi:hypothetical protein